MQKSNTFIPYKWKAKVGERPVANWDASPKTDHENRDRRKDRDKKDLHDLLKASPNSVYLLPSNNRWQNRGSLMWPLATFWIRHNNRKFIPYISLSPIHITPWILFLAIARRVENISGHIRNCWEWYIDRFIILHEYSLAVFAHFIISQGRNKEHTHYYLEGRGMGWGDEMFFVGDEMRHLIKEVNEVVGWSILYSKRHPHTNPLSCMSCFRCTQ